MWTSSDVIVAFAAVLNLLTHQHSMPVAPLATIRVEIESGLVFVPVTIDGHGATLILDTGSSLTALDSGFASSLALEPITRPVRAAGAGTAQVGVKLARAKGIS